MCWCGLSSLSSDLAGSRQPPFSPKPEPCPLALLSAFCHQVGLQSHRPKRAGLARAERGFIAVRAASTRRCSYSGQASLSLGHSRQNNRSVLHASDKFARAYVCMYVCMYVCTCMYVWLDISNPTYARMDEWMDGWMGGWIRAWANGRMECIPRCSFSTTYACRKTNPGESLQQDIWKYLPEAHMSSCLPM